jgi:redox-sensitive bicupin YhaK (pirin superfamily)
VIRPGEVQRMSAGKGVVHSEFNPSPDTPVHLLQIWILTAAKGIAPSYEQKAFADAERRDRLRLIASPDGAEGSVRIHQDARVYSSLLDAGATARFDSPTGRHGWVQVVKGDLGVNGQRLGAGDGAAVSEESVLAFTAHAPAEFLVFDLG